MSETLEQFISKNFLLIFFAIVVFIIMYKPKFLKEFFDNEPNDIPSCEWCQSILPSCNTAKPSNDCVSCQGCLLY